MQVIYNIFLYVRTLQVISLTLHNRYQMVELQKGTYYKILGEVLPNIITLTPQQTQQINLPLKSILRVTSGTQLNPWERHVPQSPKMQIEHISGYPLKEELLQKQQLNKQINLSHIQEKQQKLSNIKIYRINLNFNYGIEMIIC